MKKKKIVFVGLNSHYTPGLNYQDNCLNEVFIQKNYDVYFFSDRKYYLNGKLSLSNNNIEYDKKVKIYRTDFLFNFFACKIFKIFKSIYFKLEDIKPDIIFCHGTQFINVFDIVKYKKKYPQTRIFADTHTSYLNTPKNPIIKLILYNIYYKVCYKCIEPYLEKYFYIAESERKFSINEYHAKESIMDFMPLGGFKIDENLYVAYRNEKRNELGFNNELVFLHSGKLDKKKKTVELINIFNNMKNSNAKLVIIGNIIDKRINSLLLNKNIIYLGWMSSNELSKYMCACDVYLQPGSPSASLQVALCNMTPVVAMMNESYVSYKNINNVVWTNNIDDFCNKLNKIINDENYLKDIKNIAKSKAFILDYKNIVKETLGSI